ncbi:MAG: hypothetical protein RJA70_4972, partial [Pseudomonadota bacterium]
MLGEALSLAAAVTWSLSVVLFGMRSDLPPLALNLFKNTFAAVLLVLTLTALDASDGLRSAGGFSQSRSVLEWATLALSGFVGITIGDTLLFTALNRLGAGRLAIVECAYAPCMLMMSVLFLGEPVGWWLIGGGTLVLSGVLIAATEAPIKLESSADSLPSLQPSERRWSGVVFGLLAMVTMA